MIEAAIPEATPPTPAAPPEKLNHWAIIHRRESYNPHLYNDQPVKEITTGRDKLKDRIRAGDTIVAISLTEAYERQLMPPANRYRKEEVKDSIYLLLPGLRGMYSKPTASPSPESLLFPPDSTIHKSLGKYTINNALIVMDVTGSMAAYIAQMLRWIDQRPPANTISYLVCFNDGDRKPDDHKKPGSTGGIYGEKFEGSKQAKALVQKAMRAGNGGGDIQENACEALLTGIRNAPSATDVILIADSWAPIRDTALISTISKPVHVIICGKRLGVHPDYVTLALKTGGTLHFPDQPLINLRPLLEGASIVINQRNYYYTNGRVYMELR